jgi:hypothetical protein
MRCCCSRSYDLTLPGYRCPRRSGGATADPDRRPLTLLESGVRKQNPLAVAIPVGAHVSKVRERDMGAAHEVTLLGRRAEGLSGRRPCGTASAPAWWCLSRPRARHDRGASRPRRRGRHWCGRIRRKGSSDCVGARRLLVPSFIVIAPMMFRPALELRLLEAVCAFVGEATHVTDGAMRRAAPPRIRSRLDAPATPPAVLLVTTDGPLLRARVIPLGSATSREDGTTADRLGSDSGCHCADLCFLVSECHSLFDHRASGLQAGAARFIRSIQGRSGSFKPSIVNSVEALGETALSPLLLPTTEPLSPARHPRWRAGNLPGKRGSTTCESRQTLSD